MNERGCVEGNGVLVCFVNTEQKPVKIVRKGIFTYGRNLSDNKLYFSELCEVFYPHPDASEDAVISLLEFLPVSCPLGFETTVTYLIDAVKGLDAILTFESHGVPVKKNRYD